MEFSVRKDSGPPIACRAVGPAGTVRSACIAHAGRRVMKHKTADTATRLHFATLQRWRLFWLLAALASIVELTLWRTVDWRSSEDLELLIGFNWRLAAPYFLFVFFASPLQRVFPGVLSRWLLGNRRYLGLAFAVVCGWQVATIVLLGRRYPDTLASIHANPFQYLEDVIFAMIAVMTLTSFGAVNRHISAATWRRMRISRKLAQDFTPGGAGVYDAYDPTAVLRSRCGRRFKFPHLFRPARPIHFAKFLLLFEAHAFSREGGQGHRRVRRLMGLSGCPSRGPT